MPTLTATPQQRAQALLRLHELGESLEGGVNLAQFTYTPIDYVETILGYTPYAGMNGEAGQAEILNDYAHCIKQQHERYDYQNGIIGADELTVWEPGQAIKNTFSIDAGHTLGKTFTLALMVNHFIDCFVPSIIYSYAPKKEQIKDLLWKEIKTQRQDKGLQGRILELRLDIAANHFAKGVATDNSHGTGTEKAQGQHGKYLMFVIDEAEGVPAFVYDAIESMTSGGVANIVIVARNPRTRTCRAHKIRSKSTTKTYRLSCLNHPNVVTGREVVPNSVTRQWVDGMVADYCDVTTQHNEDEHTFDWGDKIYRPQQTFLWRVMGIAGKNTTGDTLLSQGRYEAAVKRSEPLQLTEQDKTHASIGIDVAHMGSDAGTGWAYAFGKAYKFAAMYQQRMQEYQRVVKDECRRLTSLGITHMSIRVDATGVGAGVADALYGDDELYDMFDEFVVHYVHFVGVPYDYYAFKDIATEMYADAAEQCKGLVIVDPPPELETDLTERRFEFVTVSRVEVKKLEAKDKFKKRHGRSPDDGDGFVLAVASERLFGGSGVEVV